MSNTVLWIIIVILAFPYVLGYVGALVADMRKPKIKKETPPNINVTYDESLDEWLVYSKEYGIQRFSDMGDAQDFVKGCILHANGDKDVN